MIWPSLISVEKNYFSFLASESFQMHFTNLSDCKSCGRTRFISFALCIFSIELSVELNIIIATSFLKCPFFVKGSLSLMYRVCFFKKAYV